MKIKLAHILPIVTVLVVIAGCLPSNTFEEIAFREKWHQLTIDKKKACNKYIGSQNYFENQKIVSRLIDSIVVVDEVEIKFIEISSWITNTEPNKSKVPKTEALFDIAINKKKFYRIYIELYSQNYHVKTFSNRNIFFVNKEDSIKTRGGMEFFYLNFTFDKGKMITADEYISCKIF